MMSCPTVPPSAHAPPAAFHRAGALGAAPSLLRRPTRLARIAGHGWLVVLVCATIPGLGACGDRPPRPFDLHKRSLQGDAARGQRLMSQYQCTACHHIPHVPGPAGGMGPSLAAFGQRSYIAGQVPNDQAALRAWLRDPPALVPGTAMPDLGVSEADARDMSAYLLALP